MAVVLDINLLCRELLKWHTIQKNASSYDMVICSIKCIDNWLWDNEQELESTHLIAENVNQNKIVIIKFSSPVFKDTGLYVEKVENGYLYTFWINTEGFPELDCDVINKKNRKYYEKIYQTISNLENEEKNTIKIVGIGVESEFYISGKIEEIIEKSKNILAWVFDDGISPRIEKLIKLVEKP